MDVLPEGAHSFAALAETLLRGMVADEPGMILSTEIRTKLSTSAATTRVLLTLLVCTTSTAP